MDTKKLRQKILDLAIHGKLVPQDPNDEPASVLLERIRTEKERLVKEGKIKKSLASKTPNTPHFENVPFEVPSSWVWIPLEEILELVSGQDFPPEKYNVSVSGIPYIIGASNIENEQLTINRWTEFPSVYSYLNDLLVVCKGAGVGKMAINNIGTVHIARQIQAVRAYTNCINIRYIKAVVKNNIENIISKANGLIPGLKRELLLSLQIPLPPLEEQHRIVAGIERWFDLIEKTEQSKSDLQTTIKQAKSKILDLAIHGKLVPQDPSDEPASELLKRINPKAEITSDNWHYQNLPKGWAICKLKNLCSFLSRGKSPKYSDDDKTYPVFAQKCNLKDGGISLENARFLEPSTVPKWNDIYKLRTGDILVNSTGTGTVGRTRLFHEDYLGQYPFVVPDSHVSVVRTIHEISSEYMYAYISSDLIQQYLEENLAGSTNQKELYIGVLESMNVFIPPLPEQQRIVNAIDKAFAQLDVIMESL